MDKGYAEIFYFGYKKVVFDGTPPGAGRLDGGSWLPLGSQENALEGRGHLFEPQASARHNESTYRTCHRHLLPVIWPTKKGLLHQQSIASAAGPLKYVLNYILIQYLR